MNMKLKWGTAGRLRRGVVVLGVVGLAAGAAVVSAGSALAVGSEPGNLVLTPSGTQPLTTTPTWSTTDACPAGHNTSGQLAEFTQNGTFKTLISPAVNGTSVPFNGTLDGNVAALLNTAGVNNSNPGTVEWAMGCWNGTGGTGTGTTPVVYVQSIFVSIANGATSYTTSATAPVVISTTTTVTAPSTTTTGTTINPSAEVQGSDSSFPAGTVQFQVNGTNLGAAVAVNAGNVRVDATTSTSFTSSGTQTIAAIFTPASQSYSGSQGSAQVNVTTAGSITAGSEPISVTVPQSGTLTVTVAAGTVTLAPAAPATTPDETATGALNNVTVTETRNFVPGWAVSGQESAFTGSGTAAGGTISGNALGWTPTGTPVGGALLGGTVAPSGANTGSSGPGLGSTAAILAQAHAGNGLGVNIISANLLLDIPPTVPAGPYTGSLTVTYVTSNP